MIWENPPGKKGSGEATIVVVESFGKYKPSALRIHPEENQGGWAAYCDFNDRPVSWFREEFELTPDGVKIRSTMRCPAEAPEDFIQAIRNHSLTEIKRFQEFLPELYRKEH
jgi:hypothetical protein